MKTKSPKLFEVWRWQPASGMRSTRGWHLVGEFATLEEAELEAEEWPRAEVTEIAKGA